jgi:hypothetical protein
MSRFQMLTRPEVPLRTRGGSRLHWRVIVRSTGKLDPSRIAARTMAWHLVECVDPRLASAHCQRGRLLLADGGDPDGHCLIHDTCPRSETTVAQESSPDSPV